MDYTYRPPGAKKDKSRYLDNKNGDTLPLVYAKQLCIESGIWQDSDDDEENPIDPYQRLEDNARLKEFQEMSIGCSFDDAMIVYYGFNFTEEQVEALRLIHKSTRTWLKGQLVGILMDKITSKKITNRDLASSLVTIIESLGGSTEGLSEKQQQEKTKKLVVHFANAAGLKMRADK